MFHRHSASIVPLTSQIFVRVTFRKKSTHQEKKIHLNKNKFKFKFIYILFFHLFFKNFLVFVCLVPQPIWSSVKSSVENVSAKHLPFIVDLKNVAHATFTYTLPTTAKLFAAVCRTKQIISFGNFPPEFFF